MTVEGSHRPHLTSEGANRDEREDVVPERIGGPLKANELLTSALGVKEAKTVLDDLEVQYLISLYTPEIPLGEIAEAPAEYRIQIMDCNHAQLPASEAYVRDVVDNLRRAHVPVQEASPREK
jgi:hypothetical protein